MLGLVISHLDVIFEDNFVPLLVDCLYLSTPDIRIEMNDSQQLINSQTAL